MLTACGIETGANLIKAGALKEVATVLTACGIETRGQCCTIVVLGIQVATVLTACGIET